ncbi:MAG TPA: hypothetical protein VF897_23945 [Roseiflexaceae bacterium]
MALLKRNTTSWLIRGVGALTLAIACMAGVTGQAFAHDDDEVVTYGPNACTAVADLPVYPGATCVKHKTELDDGVTETTNEYVTQNGANTVRLAFEQAFAQKGWTIVEVEQDSEDQEYDYTIFKGLHRVEVSVEARDLDEGAGTEIKIAEK